MSAYESDINKSFNQAIENSVGMGIDGNQLITRNGIMFIGF